MKEMTDIHATNYRKPSAIRLCEIVKEKNTIRYIYETEGGISRFFKRSRPFTLEYTCEVESVPDAVAAVPFAALMLPLIWVSDAALYLPALDKDFFDSIDEIKRGYAHIYPVVTFRGRVFVDAVVQSSVSCVRHKSLCFYSGGVDAVSTMLSVLRTKPTLFTIWGTDIFFEQESAWNIVKERNRQTAESFSLPFAFVKSAFRYVLDEASLTKEYAAAVGESWWHGFMHGIALLAHAAPYAFAENIADIYIAATFCAKDMPRPTCASDPLIDNKVRFCGCKVVHEGFERSRIDKLRQIVRFTEESGRSVHLRVCWEVISGNNCGVCEKCQRTIFGLYAVGADPEKFGFCLSSEVREEILRRVQDISVENFAFWDEIKQLLYAQREYYAENELVQALLKGYECEPSNFVPTVCRAAAEYALDMEQKIALGEGAAAKVAAAQMSTPLWKKAAKFWVEKGTFATLRRAMVYVYRRLRRKKQGQ